MRTSAVGDKHDYYDHTIVYRLFRRALGKASQDNAKNIVTSTELENAGNLIGL